MHTLRPRLAVLVTLALAGLPLAAPRAQQQAFMPIDEVRPGMVGVGRTVYAGEAKEEFRAHVIGVLRNVVAPGRDLVLARLEGDPLPRTGVMQGMSGSPVYIDGRLLGAVSYALGAFPREPIAGITPIAEMIDAVDRAGPRVSARDLQLSWPVTPDDVYAALGRIAERAAAPLGPLPVGASIVGPASVAELAPMLRPIGAAMVLSGLEPEVSGRLRAALAPAGVSPQAPPGAANGGRASRLEPGDAVGMSLVRGDMENGATGTVTWVDGDRVYAFGHPFLNLGPTEMAMTQAQVLTVLPSLDTSMKIAAMGPVIGTMGQDRTTAVGGTLGRLPNELEVHLKLVQTSGAERDFTFYVLQDEQLTSLFAYVAVFNTLVSFERQSGPLSIAATGSASFGEAGEVRIEDFFSGPGAVGAAANALTNALAQAASNTFRSVTPERLDLRLDLSEAQQTATIERAWLDTTRPTAGETHMLHVLLRHYRGETETISLPITMPARPRDGLTLLVSDAATLMAREQRDLRPGRPTSWDAMLRQMNDRPKQNRLYVRLIAEDTGTVVGGETLPALPPSVRSVLGADATVTSAPVTQTELGAWEQRVARALQGSRELKLSLVARD